MSATATTPEAVLTDTPAPAVRRIAMNTPANKNALGAALREAVQAALEAALAEPAVRAVILTGAGADFSAGGDLSKMDELRTPSQARARIKGAHRLALLLDRAEKPVIAAVRGYAMGAGAGLALAADTLVMAEGARIGFPFLKVGLIPDFGVSYALANRAGRGVARQALMYARTYTAAEALRLGLCDEVVAEAELDARALALAGELAAQPAHALSLTRRMLATLPGSLDALLETEAMAQSLSWMTDEFTEGLAAFREKRKPVFHR